MYGLFVIGPRAYVNIVAAALNDFEILQPRDCEANGETNDRLNHIQLCRKFDYGHDFASRSLATPKDYYERCNSQRHLRVKMKRQG